MTHSTIRLPSLLLLAVAACTPAVPVVDDHEQPADAAGTREAVHELELPADVRRNLGISFARVEARHVAETLRVPGAFELEPLARHEYRMALPGRVKLLVDQYDRVEQGTLLFRYQSPAWPELLHEIILGEQAMETAKAQIEVARAHLGEARSLLELTRERIDALAKAEFKRADLEVEAVELEASLPRLEAELALARTRLSNAERTRQHALHRAATASGTPEAELELEVTPAGGGEPLPKYLSIDWIEVRALAPGVVEGLSVTDGAFVEPPANVLSTVDPSRVRFRAQALQSDLAQLSAASSSRLVPPPAPGSIPSRGLAATLSVGLEAHPEERTVALIARPERLEPWIRPGVAAFLEVVLDETGGPALAVPRAAVVQDGLEFVLFRRDPRDPDHVLRIEADLGVSDGLWVVLQSGVARGDEVVLSGAYELKLASQASGSVQAGGHVHADGSSHADH